jgi:hypothetical protein
MIYVIFMIAVIYGGQNLKCWGFKIRVHQVNHKNHSSDKGCLGLVRRWKSEQPPHPKSFSQGEGL